MASVVRIRIQYREAGSVPRDNKILLVVTGLSDSGKQRDIRELRFSRQDVLNTPRGMERFHLETLVIIHANVKTSQARRIWLRRARPKERALSDKRTLTGIFHDRF